MISINIIMFIIVVVVVIIIIIIIIIINTLINWDSFAVLTKGTRQHLLFDFYLCFDPLALIAVLF